MCFDTIAAKDLVRTYSTVVATLRRCRAGFRKTQRPVAKEESVFLLDAKDNFLIGILFGPLPRMLHGSLRGVVNSFVRRTSVITRRLSPLRIGSGQVNTGLRTQSDLSPVA